MLRKIKAYWDNPYCKDCGRRSPWPREWCFTCKSQTKGGPPNIKRLVARIASWTCEVQMTYDERKTTALMPYSQRWSALHARMFDRHGSHCPICGRKFKPGTTLLPPKGNSDIIQIVHDSCLQAYQRHIDGEIMISGRSPDFS